MANDMLHNLYNTENYHKENSSEKENQCSLQVSEKLNCLTSYNIVSK